MKSKTRRAGEVRIEEKLFVAIVKAADLLSQNTESILKEAGLTGAQYNVLRILRGAEPEGLACSGIGERMISRDPDMTRLLDRMEKREWITRERQRDDRRVIKTRITESGLELLRKLDQPVQDHHKKQFGHLSAASMKSALDLLAGIQTHEQELESRATKRISRDKNEVHQKEER